MASRISIGDQVYLAPGVWINAIANPQAVGPQVIIGKGCKIGRRSSISASCQVVLEPNVLIAPSVVIADHQSEFLAADESQINLKASRRQLTIGQNCWLGYGAVVVCTGQDVVVGCNSIVGANAVVTKTVPPFSVVGGNPAKVLRYYDEEHQQWVRPNEQRPLYSN
jgi:acetyltransferase-like isoleucine patch superfamily enzyme